MKTKRIKWEVEIVDKQLRVCCGKQCICVVSVPKYTHIEDFETSKQTALKNAKLIASAPDLLKALKTLLKSIERYEENRDGESLGVLFVDQIYAKEIIKKATE
jgi:hypothetical protein